MEMIIDDQYRWITTNSVPDYYFNPYCPIGRGYGYCVEQEVGKFKNKMCVFFSSLQLMGIEEGILETKTDYSAKDLLFCVRTFEPIMIYVLSFYPKNHVLEF